MDAAYAGAVSCLVENQRSEVRNVIEALGNLLYLIELDAENPNLVRSYTGQAEERLMALQTLLPDSAARSTHKGLQMMAAPNPCNG
jgi:hypothetical protein